jgi:hypothetical protein
MKSQNAHRQAEGHNQAGNRQEGIGPEVGNRQASTGPYRQETGRQPEVQTGRKQMGRHKVKQAGNRQTGIGLDRPETGRQT